VEYKALVLLFDKVMRMISQYPQLWKQQVRFLSMGRIHSKIAEGTWLISRLGIRDSRIIDGRQCRFISAIVCWSKELDSYYTSWRVSHDLTRLAMRGDPFTPLTPAVRQLIIKASFRRVLLYISCLLPRSLNHQALAPFTYRGKWETSEALAIERTCVYNDWREPLLELLSLVFGPVSKLPNSSVYTEDPVKSPRNIGSP
jgi:hypothetical protein